MSRFSIAALAFRIRALFIFVSLICLFLNCAIAQASPPISAYAFFLSQTSVLHVKLECKLKNGKLVCDKIKKKSRPAGETVGDDGEKPNEIQGEQAGTEDDGETACPPGYVVLDKPNIYGNLCEPKAGFCPKGQVGTPPDCKCAEGTIPAKNSNDPKGPCVAQMNCPFPGMIGNPPDCECPKGTEFIGNKGCAIVQVSNECITFKGASESTKNTDFASQCQKQGGKWVWPYKGSVNVDDDPLLTSCCEIKKYFDLPQN